MWPSMQISGRVAVKRTVGLISTENVRPGCRAIVLFQILLAASFFSLMLISNHNEMPGVLRVDLAVGSDRQRRIRCTQSELEEDVFLQRAVCLNSIEVTILT